MTAKEPEMLGDIAEKPRLHTEEILQGFKTMTEPANLSTVELITMIDDLAAHSISLNECDLARLAPELAKRCGELMDKLRPRSWIPVSERLPVHQNFYLAVVGNDGAPARVKYLFYREEDRSFIDHHNVTHWMELPKLPDTEQEGS